MMVKLWNPGAKQDNIDSTTVNIMIQKQEKLLMIYHPKLKHMVRPHQKAKKEGKEGGKVCFF